MRRFALTLAAPLFASGAHAEPYKLNCVGTSGLMHPATSAMQPGAPYSTTFRVNPEAMQYCQSSCSAVLPIARISDNRVTFKATTEADFPIFDILYADRRTGNLLGIDGKVDEKNEWVGSRVVIAAKCTCAPFTAFPRRLF